MNRRIAMSMLSVTAALALMGGSAFAAFTSTATATSSTFSTTNPDLTVSVNGGPDGSSEPGPHVTGLIPGTPGATQTFALTNHSTDPSDNLVTTLQFTLGGGNTLPGSDMDFTVNCGGGDITHTFNEWLSTAYTIGTVPNSTFLTCTMIPTLHSGVGNSDAGKSAIFDAVFTGSVGS